MNKTKRLSLKQKNFAKEFVETGNATEAAMRAYPCKTRQSAGVVGFDALRKPAVAQEVERLLDKKEITDDFMLQRLKEGMDAKVVSSYQGEATQSEIPDHNAAFKWWEAGAKMKGFFPPEETINKNLNIDVQLENMPKEQFRDLLKGLLLSLKEVKQ
jgi:phage terminase small subunit